MLGGIFLCVFFEEGNVPSGGARSRSGPAPDPNSGRADRRRKNSTPGGIALPKDGYTGKVPAWPLPKGSQRERAMWRKMWAYPQAARWAEEPWLHQVIGLYIRWTIKAEADDAPASTLTQTMRLATTIGITHEGMKINGWYIPTDPPEPETNSSPQPAAKGERRLRKDAK